MQAATKSAGVSVAAAVPIPGVGAEIVAFRPQAKPSLERLRETASHMVGIVLPPVIVLAVILFVWQLLCSQPGASLPPPSKVLEDAWDFIADPFFDNGGIDKGAFWHISKSLSRVAVGFSLAAVAGIALGVLIGQIEVMKITNSADGCESRNPASDSGSQASGGTVRSTWKIGSSPRIAQVLWPISTPSAMPATAAKVNPTATRLRLLEICQKAPLSMPPLS